MALASVIVAAVALLYAGVPLAWASEGGGGPVFSLRSEAIKIFNFLFVVGVLWWLLKGPTARFFEDRRQKIDQAIEEAKEAKAAAEAKRAEYEAKIAKAHEDIAAIDAEGARRVEAMRAELAQAAEAAALRIAAEAEGRIAAELAQARAELQREASLLAVELAEELIKERVNEEDQRRLVEAAIEKLEGLR